MEPLRATRAWAAVGVAAAVLLGTAGPATPLTSASSTVGSRAGAHSKVLGGTQTHTGTHSGTHSGARATPRRTTPRWAGSVDVRRRSAVEAAYRRGYASGLDVPTGWTGSHSGCRPGRVSAASRAATLRALNLVRSMSGLAPVRFSATLDARAQRTALLMSANRALSHDPPPGWRCRTGVGAANAGRSNLALSYPRITSAGAIGLYLREPGSGNAAVGHRRWLLNPFATTMGSGSTDTANAITVIGPASARRPNPAWVSWPTAGWFPRPLEPGGRWSLSAGNPRTDFRRATVRVYRNGTAVRATRLRVRPGYAQPTLVWQVPARQAKSGTYRVVVRGVRRAGSPRPYGRTYTVRMFTPAG